MTKNDFSFGALAARSVVTWRNVISSYIPRMSDILWISLICLLSFALMLFAVNLFGATLEVKPGESINSKMSSLQPGDTLLVRAGTYSESLSLPRDGNASKRIVLRAYPGEKPIISSKEEVLSLNKDYWLIQGLIFDHQGAESDAMPVSGSNSTLRGCELRNGKRDGIDGSGSSANIVIENCTIHDFVLRPGDDAHGIVLNPGATGWKIINNTIYNCGGDGVQLYAENGTPIAEYSKDITISGNIFYTTIGSNSENALDFKGVDGCVVDANEMYGFENKAWVTQKGCRNIVGSNNVIHDSQRGIEFRGEGGKSQENIRLIRNVLYNIRDYYGLKFDGVSNLEVLHNTLSNVTANSFRIELEGVQSGVIRNNLIHDAEEPSISGTFKCAYDHNGWFKAGAGDLSGSGDVTGSDPRFMGASAADFRLQSSSPAKDAGADLGLPYVGAKPDLGAYEFGATTAVEGRNDLIPTQFNLHQNYPNPFSLGGSLRGNYSQITQILFDLQETSDIEISIHNLLGQKLRTLKQETLSSGRHAATWDGRDGHGHLVATGVYIYRLAATRSGYETWAVARRMIVVR